MTSIVDYGTENGFNNYMSIKDMAEDIIRHYGNGGYSGFINIKECIDKRMIAETIENNNYIEFTVIDNDPSYFSERDNKFKVPFTDNIGFLEKEIIKLVI